MMRRAAVLLLWAWAQGVPAAPVPLADADLAAVRGADGVSFAVRLQLNRGDTGVAPGDSRLWVGQQVDGRTTYTVL